MDDFDKLDNRYSIINEDFLKSELNINDQELGSLFDEFGASGINRIVLGLTIKKLGFDKNE